jgi:hypothetical protein
MIYDPFPRSPATVARIRVRLGRGDFVRAATYVNLPDPKAPSARRVKSGKRMIKRIRVK